MKSQSRETLVLAVAALLGVPAMFALPYVVRDDAPAVARALIIGYIVVASWAAATWIVTRLGPNRGG